GRAGGRARPNAGGRSCRTVWPGRCTGLRAPAPGGALNDGRRSGTLLDAWSPDERREPTAGEHRRACRAGQRVEGRAVNTSLNAQRRAAESADLAGGAEVDLLVVGGGVTGAGVALDAASRGLSVALLEARDLAFGTS